MGIVDASKLLKELADAWKAVGKQDNDYGVLRACSMSLLVLTDDSDDAQGLGATLAELNHTFPSRTIVLRLHERDAAAMDGRVSVSCWRPVGKRQQICSEQIELLASTENLAEMQSVLLGLLVPDLPVLLWCRRAEFLTDKLLELPHKLIVDGARHESIEEALAARERVRNHEFAFADLAWTRVTRWREIIYQLLQRPGLREKLGAINRVEIRHAGVNVPATACYLGAWLHRGLPAKPQIRFQRQEDAQPNPAVGVLRCLTLAGDGICVTLTRPPGVGVDVQGDTLSGRFQFPILSLDDLLREEISVAGADPVFEATLADVHAVLKAAA